jgi:hypothetical protein
MCSFCNLVAPNRIPSLLVVHLWVWIAARLILALPPSIPRRPSAPASLVVGAGKRLLYAISETIGVPGELNLGNRVPSTPALARSPLALAVAPRTQGRERWSNNFKRDLNNLPCGYTELGMLRALRYTA